MVDMKDPGSWTKGFRWYEQLRSIDDISRFLSSVEGFRCYEKHCLMVDKNNFELWA